MLFLEVDGKCVEVYTYNIGVSNKTLVTANAFTSVEGDIKKMKNISYYSCCALTSTVSLLRAPLVYRQQYIAILIYLDR